MKLTNEKLIEEVHHLKTVVSSIIQFLPPNAQHHFQQSQPQENHQQNDHQKHEQNDQQQHEPNQQDQNTPDYFDY